jgi:hypothetical protein
MSSSPYARRGALWEAHRKHYARDGDPILVWQAPTRLMNPTVPQDVIDAALTEDPSRAGAEYLAEFRSDIESYITREAVEAVTSRGVRERASIAGVQYFGFVDPSGGSSDAMTLAVAHREGETAVLDCLREVRPPFSPESVTGEFAATLKAYRIPRVRGDRYGGEWPREAFAKKGIQYRPAMRNKSDIYQSLLPAINSGKVSLLDNERLTAQLCQLERQTARGGRDSIDHPPGAHDDLANAAAGALDLVLAERAPRSVPSAPIFVQLAPSAPSPYAPSHRDPFFGR